MPLNELKCESKKITNRIKTKNNTFKLIVKNKL